jgi:hypothetical protein
MVRKGKESPLGRITVVYPGRAEHSLGRLVAEDRGMTLTEMLVTAFLMFLLIGLLGTAFYQFFTATRGGNDALTALHDLENARVWLSRDVSEAQSFTSGSSPVYGTFDCGDYSTVQYRYSYDLGNTALVREKIVDGGVESTLTLARHIAQESDVGFSVSGNLVTITLISTSGATSRSATLKVNMRTD